DGIGRSTVRVAGLGIGGRILGNRGLALRRSIVRYRRLTVRVDLAGARRKTRNDATQSNNGQGVSSHCLGSVPRPAAVALMSTPFTIVQPCRPLSRQITCSFAVRPANLLRDFLLPPARRLAPSGVRSE